MLVFLQFIHQQEQIPFKFQNTRLSLSFSFISFVPKFHQRFPIMFIQRNFLFQILPFIQQFLTRRRKSLILQIKLLQCSCIHIRFRLIQNNKIKSKTSSTIKKTNNYHKNKKEDRNGNLVALKELVFLVQLEEKRKILFAKVFLCFLGFMKLALFEDVIVDFTRRISHFLEMMNFKFGISIWVKKKKDSKELVELGETKRV